MKGLKFKKVGQCCMAWSELTGKDYTCSIGRESVVVGTGGTSVSFLYLPTGQALVDYQQFKDFVTDCVEGDLGIGC